jgi:hypothetical protein
MIVNSTVTAPTGNIQHASEGDQCLFSVNDAYSADERLSAQETDEETDGTTPTPNLDDVFRTSYSKFQDELKWKLPSGDTVEDILYKAYDQKSRASVRNSIRNWVVDLGNKEMQALFSTTDWEAIKAEVPPLPSVDAQFAQSLVRFSKVYTLSTVCIKFLVAQILIQSITRSRRPLLCDKFWKPQVTRIGVSNTMRLNISMRSGLKTLSVNC